MCDGKPVDMDELKKIDPNFKPIGEDIHVR